MLIKKRLLQIPPQPCPDVKLKKKQAWEKEDLKAAVQVIDGIVVVDAYGRKKNLVKRFFADGKNWQYYDAENETWSQTQDGGWFDRQKYVLTGPVPDEAAKILEADNWRHEQNDLGGMICDYTRKIAQDRRYRYEKNKNDRIREMVQQTHLPMEEEKKIAKWLKEDVFQPVSLLKPKNEKKKNPIRCLTCGCRRHVTGIRHKDEWVCPKCGRRTQVRAQRWILPGRKQEKEYIAYASAVPGGYAISAGTVVRRIDEDGEQTFTPDWYEVYYDGELGTKPLIWPVTSWYGWKYAKYPLDGKFYLYPGNIGEVFPEGKFGGVDLNRICGRRFNIFDLVQGNRLLAERTCKAGLYGLIGYAAGRTDNPGTFHELAGIDQNYVTPFRKYEYGPNLMYTLRYFERVFQRKGTYNEEQLKILDRFDLHGDAELYMLSEQMTDLKMINYFGRQMRIHQEESFRSLLDRYIDYLEMAELLYNEGIVAIDLNKTYYRFPKDCLEAHDRMELLCEPIMEALTEERYQRERREKDEKICREHDGDNFSLAQRADQYRSIRQPGGDLMAVFPETVADMVNEGTTLHHCVGWNPVYRERQITGEYITYFIRKKEEPEKPYFTATYKVKNGKVSFQESYGKEHKLPGKEVRAFIDAFMANVSQQICTEGGTA